MTCTCSFTVQQDDIETGALVVTAEASSTSLATPAPGQGTVTVNSNPQLTVDVLAEECTHNLTSESPFVILQSLIRLMSAHCDSMCQSPPAQEHTPPTASSHSDLMWFAIATSRLLFAAKTASCPVLMVNSGNRKLRSIDAGSGNDCSHSAELLPGQNYTCLVTR